MAGFLRVFACLALWGGWRFGCYFRSVWLLSNTTSALANPLCNHSGQNAEALLS